MSRRIVNITYIRFINDFLKIYDNYIDKNDLADSIRDFTSFFEKYYPLNNGNDWKEILSIDKEHNLIKCDNDKNKRNAEKYIGKNPNISPFGFCLEVLSNALKINTLSMIFIPIIKKEDLSEYKEILLVLASDFIIKNRDKHLDKIDVLFEPTRDENLSSWYFDNIRYITDIPSVELSERFIFKKSDNSLLKMILAIKISKDCGYDFEKIPEIDEQLKRLKAEGRYIKDKETRLESIGF